MKSARERRLFFVPRMMLGMLLLLFCSGFRSMYGETPSRISDFRITILSTMLVGETEGLGEWGFSALLEADGHRILVDTGAHPATVLENARDLKVDLSNVEE